MIRIPAIVAACGLLAACVNGALEPTPTATLVAGPAVPGDPPGTLLGPLDYLAMVGGNTIEGMTADGRAFATFIAEDGAQRHVSWPNGVETRSTGQLTVSESMVCSAWQGAEDAPRCALIYQNGDTFHAVWAGGGGRAASYRIVPGNPRDL